MGGAVKRDLRIFLGTREIAGYYAGLKQGFETLGVVTTLVDLSGHPFAYGGGLENGFIRLMRRAARKKRGLPWLALDRLLRWLLFLWMAPRHDVFIFGFAETILRDQRDLPLLKLLGKTIICYFHGSDSRPPYMDGAVDVAESEDGIAACMRLSAQRKRTVQRIDRYADYIVDTPVHGQFHERTFLVPGHLGVPTTPPSSGAGRDGVLPKPSRNGRAVRILHSPSNPLVKGTAEIRDVIARLRAKGHAIELVEVVGQPNAVVLDELARCDFVVDQLYSDWAMPGLATEAAWCGKPVVIAGYAHALWPTVLPPDRIPPTCFCHPDRLEASVERLVEDEAFRLDLGARARAFVERHWRPEQVAERYLRVIRGEAPPEWNYDPDAIRYLGGAGLAESQITDRIRRLVDASGPAALQLDDKPELKQACLDLAYGTGGGGPAPSAAGRGR